MLAAGDLQQITQIARQMVTMYGMSEIGPWTLTDPTTQSSDVVLRMLARNSMSEKLAAYMASSACKTSAFKSSKSSTPKLKLTKLS
ncbi:ATP-dependent zinc metalloprotease FTSH 6, chloroplastic, variant 2 [Trifolium repens]|nr:ATP-dependent zinc metalloprotease FTSH 6, chloroplastic, variant 2 [Trifolium repens]